MAPLWFALATVPAPASPHQLLKKHRLLKRHLLLRLLRKLLLLQLLKKLLLPHRLTALHRAPKLPFQLWASRLPKVPSPVG